MTDRNDAPPPERVFRPLTLGPVTLRNRIFVSAHTTNLGERHEVSDRLVAYHRERAAGGVGLVVTEGLRVHPTTLKRPEALSVWSDDAVAPLRRLTAAVQGEGAAIFAQILHSGREAADDYTRTPSWGPSPIPWSRGAAVPHAMTTDEIDELVDCFAGGVLRAAAAGFDGVEIHLGHGHLLQQFLSPISNGRDDEYGGTPANRARLVERVLTRTRGLVPAHMAFGVRISAEEFVDGGLGVDVMSQCAAQWAARYRLDFVDVSHSAYVGGPSLSTQMADMSHGPAPFAHLGKAVRDRLPDDVATLLACRIDSLDVAEDVLAAGCADATAMTRAHIADPGLIRKHRGGEVVRRCTSCNQLCIGRSSGGLPISCVVNPEVGLEEAWREAYAAADRVVTGGRPRLLVVGGGPAGMEAALTATRWADVTLVEREPALGGALRTARALHGRSGWARLVEDQERTCRERGVELRPGVAFDAGLRTAEPWDGIVLATGAIVGPRWSDDRDPVRCFGSGVPDPAGVRRAAVHDDRGGWEAWGVVAHLVHHGVETHYVTPLQSLAPGVTIYSRLGLLAGLRASDLLHVHLMTTVSGWRDRVLTLRTSLPDAETAVADVDALWDAGVATPAAPRRLPVPHRVVGDAYAPRDAGWAVYSGRLGALRILADIRHRDDPVARSTAQRGLDALPLHTHRRSPIGV
ncbi:FAD-binding protein [Pseudonocardia benzenivorans]|uniref:FAD-binding protein n=1 Tax=Pseudonocardia benzenivorans TaxID=228005 RepID=A0ABW3VKS6_9PSEU